MTATTGYDFADRPVSLSVDDAGTPRPWVTAGSYKPFGPLDGMTFGNTLVESRGYDSRYRLSQVQVGSVLDWSFTYDDVGNPTRITDNLASATRDYAYLDSLYFLTQGDGPWGTRSWTYDKIGNRLSETKNGALDPYVYAQQGMPPHNTPKLLSRTNRTYGYDAIGNQTSVNTFQFLYNDAKELSGIDGILTFSYDGRGYLLEATKTAPGLPAETSEITYSSEGMLRHRRDVRSGGTLISDAYFFYLGSRPVGVLEKFVFNGLPSTTVRYLTTDELGTPILATGPLRRAAFLGGFEPFGADVFNAQGESVSLRFPGQWQDDLWEGYSKQFELHYNVHRWYDNQVGRYTAPDPLGLDGSGPNVYFYAKANPLVLTDPDGRKVVFEDWPADRRPDGDAAVQQIKDQLQKTPCCVKGDRAEKILDLLNDPNREVKLKFKPDAKHCGFTSFSVLAGFNNTIRIGPGAWNCCQKGGPSGVTSLASTILHELHHFFFRTGERPAYEAEKKCFGCQAQGQ